jgi:hypothetical protein
MKNRTTVTALWMSALFSSLALADGALHGASVGLFAVAPPSPNNATTAASISMIAANGETTPCYQNTIQLTDLTNDFQQKAYSLLLNAKLNNLPLSYVSYNYSNYQCFLNGVAL